MSEPPQPFEISYESVGEFRNAPMLVRLAGIFALCSAGLSALGGLVQAAAGIFMAYIMTNPAAFGGRAAPPPPSFPGPLMYVYYGGLAVAALAVAVVKVIGGIKLLRLGRGVWGWGLAAGIVGCVELLWCSLGCVIPLAAGIYTIVILCLDHVRAYLQAKQAARPVG